MLTLQQSYAILNVSEDASDEEVARAYKKLALQYHPDKNPHRAEWANSAMATINVAYTTIMAHRFKSKSTINNQSQNHTESSKSTQAKEKKKSTINDDLLTHYFIRYRERAKDALYQYFQYNLYNIALRDIPSNSVIFKKIVTQLRKSYHGIQQLCELTNDREFLQHFHLFMELLFTFYKSSECLTIIDSYANIIDVEAFRLYRRADEYLLRAQKEIFYERHNRGFFKKESAISDLIQAIQLLELTLIRFPQSSWIVESNIKLEHARTVEKYLKLFFEE